MGCRCDIVQYIIVCRTSFSGKVEEKKNTRKESIEMCAMWLDLPLFSIDIPRASHLD
jgi:hypothetical protein